MSIKKIITLVFILSLITVSGYFAYRQINKKVETNPAVEKFNPECTRNERLENKPQYDRALSLIQQRIQESIELDKEDSDVKTAFNYFPSQLVNCIYIEEEDLSNIPGVEGYFTFDSSKIKNNYFTITVDKNYKEADDIVTALLIAHEMEHVQQFLQGSPLSTRNDCLRAEADAFVAQWMLFGNLSMEEMESVNARIERDTSLHAQLQMIKNIRSLSLQYALPACGFMSKDCDKEVLKVQMFKVLFEDEFYRKQCEK